MQKITIIGSGEIGHALKVVLRHKKIELNLFDKDPNKNPGQKPLSKIIPDNSIIFICVPGRFNRSATKSIKPYLSPKTIVVTLSKAIEKRTLKTMDQVLMDSLPRNPIGILGGPMLAEEIEENLMAAGVIASHDQKACQAVAKLFQNTQLKIDTSNDPHGVSLAGVLKNIYAIGLGIIEGLESDNNAKGWYISKAIEEMEEIIELLGGADETAIGPGGLGDLVATGFSGFSNNHKLGFELATIGKSEIKSEGLLSIESIHSLLKENSRRFKALNIINDILIKHLPPKNIIEKLI